MVVYVDAGSCPGECNAFDGGHLPVRHIGVNEAGMPLPHQLTTSGAITLLLMSSPIASGCGEVRPAQGDVDASIPLLFGDCPVDVRAPIPKPACSQDQESSEGKWSEEDAVHWQSSADHHLVRITVRGGLTACPQSGETGAAEDYRLEWHREAQRCLSAVLNEFGVSAQSNQGNVNVIFAEVTWDQIQELGRRLDVDHIHHIGRPPRP